MEDKETEKSSMLDKIKKQVEEQIKCISEETVQPNNVDYLYRLVDIHKDLLNEDYWKMKEDNMRYRSYNDGRMSDYNREYYNEYGRGRKRDSRGRYTDGGDFYENRGRRYRGHDMIDEMYDHYGNYSENKESMNRGNYGAKDDTMKSLEYMLQSMVDFVEMLKEEANSQEEMEMIRHYTKKISEM